MKNYIKKLIFESIENQISKIFPNCNLCPICRSRIPTGNAKKMVFLGGFFSLDD